MTEGPISDASVPVGTPGGESVWRVSKSSDGFGCVDIAAKFRGAVSVTVTVAAADATSGGSTARRSEQPSIVDM